MPATSQKIFVGGSDRVAEGKRLVVDVGDATIGIFRVDLSAGETDLPRVRAPRGRALGEEQVQPIFLRKRPSSALPAALVNISAL